MGLTRLQLRTARAFLLVFLALVLPTAAAPRRESARVKTILVLGDSLSDGFRLSRSQAYPALLAQKLGAIGLNYDVINASVSGGTTSSGLPRLAAELTRKIDIFILELGINDAFRGISVPQIRDNLQALIDRVKTKNAGVRVIVVGMQLPNYSTDDFVRAYGEMYVDLAAKNHAGLVPYLLEGVGGNPELNLPDLIHPNATGHKILANNVWRVLEPIAREVAAY
ncbi:MAG: arylesterase [Verrucomicrobiota bacterium]|nr:arylesterase [Verrucomicrobiota bacterium]